MSGDKILRPKQALRRHDVAARALGEIHRLVNRRTEPIVLIEVQSGNCLGEDDIIRLEDLYNRGRTYTT